MAFIARSRTEPAGMVATGGSVTYNFNVGSGTSLNFGDSRLDHSGQFTRPIQQLVSFYDYIRIRIN
jgi:hypothetical protein